jgi:hypothetical protein
MAAVCYFCLEDGKDDDEKPVVRNCSCRGDSAGFAHLSCLIKNATHKSLQITSRTTASTKFDATAFTEPWETCINCKQSFKGQLALDLGTALVSFAESTYYTTDEDSSRTPPSSDARTTTNKCHPIGIKDKVTWDIIKVLTALRTKINIFHNNSNMSTSPNQKSFCLGKSIPAAEAAGIIIKTQCEADTKKMLSLAEQLKRDLQMDKWVHMSKTSAEFQMYRLVCGKFEAQGHRFLGMIVMSDHHDLERYKIANTHFMRALIIFKLIGEKELVQLIESHIASVKTCMDHLRDEKIRMPEEHIESSKQLYEKCLSVIGLNSEGTISAGISYARMLKMEHRGIEAERLVAKLVPVALQVYGPEHTITKSAKEALDACTMRLVVVNSSDPNIMNSNLYYQALHYVRRYSPGVLHEALDPSSSDFISDLVMVKGPLNTPTCVTRPSRLNLFIPYLGCPVMCHGLGSATYLNGKVGEIRAIHKIGQPDCRLAVHFEEKNQKPASVKPDNLRIVFKLPPV